MNTANRNAVITALRSLSTATESLKAVFPKVVDEICGKSRSTKSAESMRAYLDEILEADDTLNANTCRNVWGCLCREAGLFIRAGKVGKSTQAKEFPKMDVSKASGLLQATARAIKKDDSIGGK
jgi:hypothetical protein